MKYGCFKSLAVIALSLTSLSSITALGNINITLKDNINRTSAQNLSFVDLIYRERSTQNPEVTRINVLEATSSNVEATNTVYNPERLQVTGQIVGQYVNEHYQTIKLKAGPSCQFQHIKQYITNANQNIEIDVSEDASGHQTQCLVNSKINTV
jgi:hypothetical protein